MNFTGSFGHFGVHLRRSRGIWSGVSIDGSVVVVALWEDGLRVEGGKIFYDDRGELVGSANHGARLRLRHLNYALATGAEVRIVQVRANDTSALPRTINKCWPDTKHSLKVVSLDQRTGSFCGELIRAPWYHDEELRQRYLVSA